MAIKRLKYFECYYGQSGTAKSEAAKAVIKRIYHDTGKIARVVVGDGSAATYMGLAGAGVVEMADFTIRDWPVTTLQQFAQGFWPEDVDDPDSKMVPMTEDQAENIGVYVIEGLSVAGGYIMGDAKGGFAEQGARGIRIGGEPGIKMVDALYDKAGNIIPDSGPGTTYGGNTISHFGQAQTRMKNIVEMSKALPGWGIWTAHENLGEDKAGGKMYGPEVVGTALTTKISAKFNNTLHFATAQTTRKIKDPLTSKQIDEVVAEYRIYTKPHFLAEGTSFVKFLAVCRTPDGPGMPPFFTSPVQGQSILDFYDNIIAAHQRERDLLVRPVIAAA